MVGEVDDGDDSGEGVVENFQHFQFSDKKKLNEIG